MKHRGCTVWIIIDWSLFMGRGGGYKMGLSKKSSFTPTKRWVGAGNVLAMLKGGGTTRFEVPTV